LTKHRSLIKSKFRKGSLSRTEENYLSLVGNATFIAQQNQLPLPHPTSTGSTALNYSNSNVSNQSQSSNSRKSLISNPINFQHLQHMGPNDGKSFMTTDISVTSSGLPPLSSGSRLLNISTLNNSPGSEKNMNYSNSTAKKSTSSSGIRQIAKKEISAPTNFRHVIRGLDDYGVNAENQENQKTSNSLLQSPQVAPTSLPSSSPSHLQQQQHQQQQQQLSIKSSSLSSSSSSSFSIPNSPNSPNSPNNENENLSQAINNTLKASSVLYNGMFEVFL